MDGESDLDTEIDTDPEDTETEIDGDSFATVMAKVFSGVVVALCCIYVLWVVKPNLVLRDTTPTGGDMGAHVWGPAYLRDELLPSFRLTGWTNDWYAGFPAYTFYMVVPSLMIVVLDVGVISPTTILGGIASLLVVAAAAALAWQLRSHPSRLARFAGWTACLAVPLLCIDLPYNVAFKLIAVSGIVAFPAGVWYLLRGLSLRRPGPELGAIASVAFLMDKSLFHIYGGNIASTMAGEFAFSISLTLSMFALGSIAMGLRTGRHRARSAVLIALAMLCHVIPGVFFLAVGAVLMVLLRPRVRSLTWALPVGLSGGLMALWWYLPFYGRSSFLNDMGWEKLGVEIPPQSWARTKVVGVLRGLGSTVADATSCDAKGTVVNWHQMWRNLLPFAPHHIPGLATPPEDPNMWGGTVFFILAAVGVVLSLVMVVRSGIWLTALTAIAAVAFVLMPQDRFWNARVLPFYYLGIYLLAAVGVTLLLRSVVLVFRGRWTDPPLAVSIAYSVLAMLVLWAGLGMTLRSIPGGKYLANTPDGKAQFGWPCRSTGNTVDDCLFTSTYQGPVRDWAKWNFEGLEAKPGYQIVNVPVDPNDPTGPAIPTTQLNQNDSAEYFGMIKEMNRLGQRPDGCGRAFWEYDEKLNNYGTPMAPMLLPYFTDHCIGSMEGLYFEASSTTPFHFLVQSELSQKPSRPERFDCHLGFDESPYRGYDIDAGIKHLQMLGVKYYMALTDESKKAADGDDRLTQVGASGPWKVYEVSDIDLVSPLENEPVVWDDVHDDIYSWARPAVDWFNDEESWDVLRASSGPDDWKRVGAKDAVSATKAPHPDLKVTNVETTNESISFDVSDVGSPVLVRTSYFPNWKADGADGVYRVTPNFMVVVPTDKHVTLTYTRAPMELISLLLSAIGAAILLYFVVRPLPPLARKRGEFFGDRDPAPDPEPGIGDFERIPFDPMLHGAHAPDAMPVNPAPTEGSSPSDPTPTEWSVPPPDPQ